MSDYQNLSESELKVLINKAETALKSKQENKRKEVIAQIRQLAASIDVQVEIIEDGKKASRRKTKVAIKYRHPQDSEKTWTGRGITPKWLQALLNKGHSLSEFEIQG